jgi:hypothetical protein
LFLVAFAASDATYVWTQYEAFVAKSRMTKGPYRLFEDIEGLLTSARWIVPRVACVRVRVLAALGTLVLCALARRDRPARSEFENHRDTDQNG